MANVEHAKQLRQGVERWNQWREKNPKIQPDLSGAPLRLALLHRISSHQLTALESIGTVACGAVMLHSIVLASTMLLGILVFGNLWRRVFRSGVLWREADLSGINLSDANLCYADLGKANLCRADLSGANLSKSLLNGADLSRSLLNGANVKGANVKGADLSGSRLTGATLDGADLSGANLSRTDLDGVNLDGANLSGADLSGADLSSSRLTGADLFETNLSKANLQNTNLQDANLQGANLSEGNLHDVNLCGANLRGADLRRANLRRGYLSQLNLQRVNFTQAQLVATNLVNADLRGAILFGGNLQSANLQGAKLNKAYLAKANLKTANLSWVSLQQANLTGADLRQTILCNANLTQANLLRANLTGADLRQANLQESICEETQFVESKLGTANLYKVDATRASFYKANAIGVNFQRAILTGSCIEDWNINSNTSLKDVVCAHIYLQKNHQERRPHGGSFQLGEFAQRFQKFLETVDLFFVDGVDWKAFLTSFQDLQSEYGDDNLAIQGIDRKAQNSFEIRLAVSPEVDKAEIEKAAYEHYEINLQQIEAQCREQLAAKEGELIRYRQQTNLLKDELLDAYRQQSRRSAPDLMEVVKILAARDSIVNVEAPAVAENTSPKYDLRNAQFAGSFAETVQGDQIGGTINNYGSNAEDITRLLSALRAQAQSFPTDQKDDANDALDLLERDLAEEQPDQGRIGRRLKKLVALGAAIGTIASGAAAVSGDVSTFTGNVIELTEQLGIPVEQVQLPSSNQP